MNKKKIISTGDRIIAWSDGRRSEGASQTSYFWNEKISAWDIIDDEQSVRKGRD